MLKKTLLFIMIVTLVWTIGCNWNDPAREEANLSGSPLRFKILNNAFGTGSLNVKINDFDFQGLLEGQEYPVYEFSRLHYGECDYNGGIMNIQIWNNNNIGAVELTQYCNNRLFWVIAISLEYNDSGSQPRIEVYPEPSSGVHIRFRNEFPVKYWDWEEAEKEDRLNNNPDGYLAFGFQRMGGSINDIHYYSTIPYLSTTTYFKIDFFDIQTNAIYYFDPFFRFENEPVTSYQWKTTMFTDEQVLANQGSKVDLGTLEPGGYYSIETFLKYSDADPIITQEDIEDGYAMPTRIRRMG